MKFNKKEKIKKFGEKAGFILMYFIFTTLLYFILKFLNKIPNWNYFHILLLTFFIMLIGILLKWFLES